MKLKRFLQTVFLSLLHMQNSQLLLSSSTNMQNISTFQAKKEHHKAINVLLDETYNNIYLFSCVASHANNDVLCYH